jgi:6-phosphogluconolactonase
MKIEIFPDVSATAHAAATFLAAECRAAVTARGRFVVALSGGTTPWLMLRVLTREDIPWDAVHVFQADERVAAAGTADRNLTHLLDTLSDGPLKPEQIHPMPVDYRSLEEAAQRYEQMITAIAGTPPVLDVAHLGLGADGHTAALLPRDPALHVTDAEVAVTGMYQGRRRLTLTYPILNRSRRILWLITGREKAAVLARLRAGDVSIPAGAVRRDHAVIFADRGAAGGG